MISSQLRLIKLFGLSVGFYQPRALALLAIGRGSGFFVAQLHTGSMRQLFYRFSKTEVVHLDDERNDIAALATTKAVPVAARGVDVEGRALLIVEGAQALQAGSPSTLESYVFAHNLIDLGTLAHQGDIFVANSTSHARDLRREPNPAGRHASIGPGYRSK